jgi:hypothetical protein
MVCFCKFHTQNQDRKLALFAFQIFFRSKKRHFKDLVLGFTADKFIDGKEFHNLFFELIKIQFNILKAIMLNLFLIFKLNIELNLKLKIEHSKF